MASERYGTDLNRVLRECTVDKISVRRDDALMTKPKTIFEFKDYRVFLAARFETLKKEKPRSVSLESFARRLDLSKSYFRYVITSKRHITLNQVPRFARVFALSRHEKQALIYMVCRANLRDPEMRLVFSSILLNLADRTADTEVIENYETKNSAGMLQDWLAMVIHSLASQSSFQPNAKWIQTVLRSSDVSLETIERVLKSLLETKSIVQDSQAMSWKPAKFVRGRPIENPLTGYKVFQTGLSAARLATEEIERYGPAQFYMMTLSFKKDSVDEIRTILSRCRDDLVRLSQSIPDPTSVAIFNLNFATMASDL